MGGLFWCSSEINYTYQSNNKKQYPHVRHCLLFGSNALNYGRISKWFTFLQIVAQTKILCFYIKYSPCTPCAHKLLKIPCFGRNTLLVVVGIKSLMALWIPLTKSWVKTFIPQIHPAPAAPAILERLRL